MNKEFFAQLEGGSSKCFFTLGVLQTLLEEKIKFSGFAGVSAGSVCSLLSFTEKVNEVISQLDEVEKSIQCALNKRKNLSDVCELFKILDHDLGLKMKQAYKKAYAKKQEVKIFAGTTNLNGEKIWFVNNNEYDKFLKCIASCTMPGFSAPVMIDGNYYVDGAIYEGLCLDIAPKNCNHLAIFTRPKDFYMTDKDIPTVWKNGVFENEKLIECLQMRPKKYNHTRKLYEQLAKNNQAICIYPETELDVSILEYAASNLRELVRQGNSVAEKCLENTFGK